MAALLALYLIFTARYALVLVTQTTGVGVFIGVALAVLPVIGAWALIAELLFVTRAERLLRRLRSADALPVDDLPRLPSGRIDSAAADAQFPAYRAAVESNLESWEAWLLLGLAYDASGDRKRARWAAREAIRLSRS